MALRKCPECGNDMSDTLKTCPHCGYRIKKERQPFSRKNKILVIIIAAVLVLGTIGSITVVQITTLTDEEKVQVELLNNKISEKLAYDISTDSATELERYRKECQAVTTEYNNLNWRQRNKVDNYGELDNRISETTEKINEIETNEINEVIKLIDAIGDVTLDSKSRIDKAENAYIALVSESQKKVTNSQKIAEAKDKFYQLSVNNIITLINNIGDISLNSNTKNKIDQAREAFDDLPDEYQKNVSNYSVLTAKEAKYGDLNTKKLILQNVKSEIKDGNLNSAKNNLKKLPSNFSYNGTKASTLKKTLNKKSNWVALCGQWSSTGGQMRVTQTSKNTGSSTWWYHDFKKNEYTIDVRCRLNKNGTVTVKISGSIPVYTSFSVVSAGVDQGTRSVTKTKKMTQMGTIRIDKYTTLTLSKSGITVSYKQIDRGEDIYFNYTYSTNMRLNKRSKKY